MISTVAFFLIAAAAVVQIIFLIRKQNSSEGISQYLLLAAAVLLLITIVTRSIKINFVAVTNTFESLVFFSAVISLVLFAYKKQGRIKVFPGIIFGGTIVALALLAIASSPIAPKDIQPPIPALQSGWLILHVTFSFIGESFFVVGFFASIIYLVTKNEEKKSNADRITYTSIGIGYPIFTVGALIFGAIWAKYAWGTYWGWDPKETWALITWLVYTAYLHSRFIKKMRGKWGAILSIVGFLFTLFTFFGVNFLLSGLHSYS